MKITTTDRYIKIYYGGAIFTHPIDSVSYTVNKDSTGITLFRNNEAIGTSPIENIEINNESLNHENLDSLLSQLFSD